MPRVVLNPGAVSHFLKHLQVIIGSLQDALGFYQSIIIAKSKHRVMSKYWKKRIAGRFVYRIKLAISGKEPDGYVTVSIKAGLPYVGKRPADGDKVYVMKLYREKIRKKGRIKKVFVKKGSLIPGIYNEKEDAVLFERKNGLKKQYFSVVKQ